MDIEASEVVIFVLGIAVVYGSMVVDVINN